MEYRGEAHMEHLQQLCQLENDHVSDVLEVIQSGSKIQVVRGRICISYVYFVNLAELSTRMSPSVEFEDTCCWFTSEIEIQYRSKVT